MQAKQEFRDRNEVEVAILDALVERGDEGMTVFELRSHVAADIDELETALTDLKNDDLITVDENGERKVIKPDDSVVPEPGEPEAEEGFFETLRDKLPF